MEKRELVISSISEAFSMHPNYIRVTPEDQYESYYDKPTACKEIKCETKQVDSDKACDFYVGYNYEGQVIFEYLRSSVNVHYKP